MIWAVWSDCKYKKINIIPVLLVGLLAMLIRIVFNENIIGGLTGGLLGFAFLLLGKLSHQALGYGDAWILACIGALLGIGNLLVIIILSFSLSFIYASIVLLLKRVNRKTSFPFIPFIACAYMGVCIL